MPRQTYRTCKDCGSIHETSQWPKECFGQFSKARSPLPCPAIRADGMDAIVNHADGRLYDSRSAYERSVKAAGCEIIGNDTWEPPRPEYDPGNVESDIKQTIEQLGGL